MTGNLSDLTNYFRKISKVKVAGTSIFQFLGIEILEKLKACVCKSSCGECECCTSLKNALIDVQTEIIQSSSHMENEPMESLSETTSKVVSSTNNDDDGNQKAKKLKKSVPGVFGQQKSRVVKPLKFNTQKTPNSKPEPKVNKKKKVAEELTNISAKKRKKNRDERDLNSLRNLPSRFCTKNISYNSKIPHIRSPYDLQEKKKPSMGLPKKLNFSLGNKCFTHRAKKSNPSKKPYQQENIPEQVFCYKGTTRSDNNIINVKGDDKQCQIYVKGHTIPRRILRKLGRTAGVGETISSSFLKKHFSNLQLVNAKRRTLYSPRQWMSSSEFATMSFD